MGKPEPSSQHGHVGYSVPPRTQRTAVALTYGALCHGLFGLGVGSMVVGMGFGMTLGQGPFTGWTAFAVNALLLLQFPIGHSVLLSRPGRAVLKRL
ncbi:MAG: hypothetical protein AAFO79_09755, partial [Pseudomonadota bacterium]